MTHTQKEEPMKIYELACKMATEHNRVESEKAELFRSQQYMPMLKNFDDYIELATQLIEKEYNMGLPTA